MEAVDQVEPTPKDEVRCGESPTQADCVSSIIHIIVDGTPRSLQSSAKGKEQWKAKVQACAEARMESIDRLQWCEVSVRIIHFCFDWSSNKGDLDNIAKPILDALAGVVFFDDNQVQQLYMRRTDLKKNKLTIIDSISPLLADRLQRAYQDTEGAQLGFVYITVEADIDHARLT